MIDLAPIRFPDGEPLYSISEYLSPGVVRLGGARASWAHMDGNWMMLSLRCNPSGAIDTDNTIARGLPPELWPPANTPDTAQQGLFLLNDGRVWMRNEAGLVRDFTEINAMFIAPRRPE